VKRPVAAGITLAIALASFAGAQGDEPQKITREGVGKLRIGMTHEKARELGLVGRKRPGCELAGPQTRSARLKAPLEGSVNLTNKAPREIRDITVKGGAEARGVGIGDKIRDIKDAYPTAKVDHSTDETFLLTLVRIPRDGGGKIVFGVSTETHKITVIGVPYIAFCE
jgi:hypothetical protein